MRQPEEVDQELEEIIADYQEHKARKLGTSITFMHTVHVCLAAFMHIHYMYMYIHVRV